MAPVGDIKPDIEHIPFKSQAVQKAVLRAVILFIVLMTLSVAILTNAYEIQSTEALRDVFRRLLTGLGIFFFALCIYMFWVFWKRQLAEETLRQEQLLIQILNDAIPAPVFYKDTQGIFIGCNRGFENFLGKERKEIIGKTAFDFFPIHDAEHFKAQDDAFFISKEPVQIYERVLIGAGERRRDFVVTKAKFSHPDGGFGGVVAILFDMTEQKKLESHLKEANEDLLKINNELRYKNEQITSGIKYASHIQNGILLDREEIIEHFEEAFILFKPKDILSGDFYWFAQKEDLLMIAAVDCTGHGVPGALMTILGNDLLNQIVYEQGVVQPDLILRALDLKLRIALQKRNEKDEVSDGMEMSLCVIDSKNSTLQFSGAKNPLYWVRNGSIEEVNGSHSAIGGRQMMRDKVFDLHTRKIEKGDVFYIFTDGFQDQLNEEGRKFMSRHLREFLAANHSLPLREQDQKLSVELENWRGNKPQTDDVLVIGVKVV